MIYILGAGGTAREILSFYGGSGRLGEIGAFIVEIGSKSVNSKIHGKEVLNELAVDSLPKNSIFIAGIGSSKRRACVERIEEKGFDFDILLHPRATVSDYAKIGKGCVVSPGVIISADTEIRRHTIVHLNTTIGHDCIIGSFVTICPGVIINGNVRVGDGCWIGSSVTIANNVSIGRGSFIGIGAVVTKDIPENVLAVGVPAKPIRKLNEAEPLGINTSGLSNKQII